jgi:diguanylate cyclase (GGDEF)-like protein/PAS domain S-box-containing protein
MYRWPNLIQLTGVSILFALSIKLTITYLAADAYSSIFWIPSGMGLAILLIGGQTYLPAIFLGALASDLPRGSALLPAATIAFGITLETWVDYYLLTQIRIKQRAFNPHLTHIRDYLCLAAIAAPCAVISSFIGITTLWLASTIPHTLLASSLLNWWMGNTLGVITITPLILVWRPLYFKQWQLQRKIEAALCFGLAFLFGQIVFMGWYQSVLGMVAHSYWPFLFVIWGATRFGRRGGLLITIMSTLQALRGALQGVGFFATDYLQSGLVNLWLYAMVLNTVGVLLALLINERKHAEIAAQESEERHRTLVEWSPEAIAVHRKGEIIYANPAAIKMIGATSAQDLIGHSILRWVHADFYHLVIPKMNGVANRHADMPMIQLQAIKLDGSVIDVEIQSTAIILDGKPAVHVLIRDITKSKQADQYELFRSKTLELLAGGEALPKQLAALVCGIEQLHPQMLCSILLSDTDVKYLHQATAPSLPYFYNQALEGMSIAYGVGSCGTAAFLNQCVIVEDIASHPYWANYKILAEKAGLGACWSQPILSSTGQVLGTFAIYHRQAHAPTADDIHIIEQSAHLASIAIERNVVAAKLKASEAHYRLLTENVSDVAWKQDINDRFTYISPADEVLRGYPANEVLGKNVFEHLTEEGIQLVKKLRAQRSKEDHRSVPSKSYTLELQQRCKDGRLIWTEILSTPERDNKGKIIGYYGITRDITQRKHAEAELRIAAIAFQSQEGIFVTDVNWVILRVNKAFTTITGYSEADALGQTPIMLSSLRHNTAFYTAMTQRLKAEGTWQGEIWNKRKNGETFPSWLILTEVKTDLGILTHYVATLTDITARKAAENQIESLAFYDPLTALPNRRLLIDRLTQTMISGVRKNNKGALLFIDLDNFKVLNDTLGHDKGDLLLIEVAKRLSACTRNGDTVARLGGDEFVVMLEDLSANALEAASEAEAVGDKILQALNQSYQLAGYAHHSTPSIGITLFGEHAESIDEPLKRADLAMYQAKAAGRNTLRFFDPQMQADVSTRVALETGLRDALEKKQFLLYYQAQVQASGQLIGAEALVRWQHPEHGMVSPAQFIPLAEESGLILTLGHWVLETACEQLAQWAKQAEMQHLTIAVNVSPKQFHQRDFVERVLAVLARTGAKPQRLKLELTESVLIANIEDVILKMSTLKQRGVCFSIDDFGTGYSSLSYLKRLPLDQLKIDQSFVHDILTDSNDAAIAKMVIVLADSLGLAVIAEGVETAAQRDFLARQGCNAYQGYLFSRPLPIKAFEAFAQTEQFAL